jgi:hypothetical protein
MNQLKVSMDGGIKRSKGDTFPISLPIFKPSRNSVTHREESHASAVDKIVQLVPTAEEEATAAIGAAVLGAVTCAEVGFG